MNLWDRYHSVFDTYGDPRVKGWFLMSSPLPTACICIAYALFVTRLGPRWMRDRKPFELRRTIIGYNLLQVVLSSFLFYEAASNGWLTFYSYSCQPVDYSTHPVAVRTVRGCYLYYLSKFFEFFDTIFFVLRKSNHQISTLHVIHHGVMPLSVWFGVKFTAGGNSTFFGFLNTFVHIVMYSYYLLAALGPRYRRYLWWKRYLTVLQMAQFAAVGVHAGQLFFIDCDYPKAFVYAIFGHAIMFLYLFYKFYDRSYAPATKAEAKAKTRADEDNATNNNLRAKMCFPGDAAKVK